MWAIQYSMLLMTLCARFILAYAGKFRNEYDGRTKVLPWTSNQTSRQRHIHTLD